MLIGICDDDQAARQTLKELIDRQQGPVILQTCLYGSAQEMLAANEVFDLVFLDIEMADMDGLTLAERLLARLPSLLVVFVSAHPRYVAQSYRLNTFQFLFKPIDEQLFQQELRRALARHTQERYRYTVTVGQQTLSLKTVDIAYLESQGRRLHIHMADGTIHTAYQRMWEAAEQLEKFQFYRCSQSYLVNLRYVSAVTGDKVTVTTRQFSQELTLSRTFGKAFRQHYYEQLPRRR